MIFQTIRLLQDSVLQQNDSFTTYHTAKAMTYKGASQYAVAYLLLVITLVTASNNSLIAQARNIKNDTFWYTSNGQGINSQGGGIFQFANPITGRPTYYWYGVHYKEADVYRSNPTVSFEHATFEAVTCYSSNDLVNWTFENNVLTNDELLQHGSKTWVGRLGVAYIAALQKYAMVVQHGSQVLIAVSDAPTGQFVWHQQISMMDMIGTSNTGDQTVFTDTDNGKSYLIYSYGKGRNKIYVSEIGVKNGMVNLLDCSQVYAGESREGNCLFKYQGKYYMCASNIYGWDASFAYYLVADDIRGPYTPTNNMQVMAGSADDYAHVTQTGFFYNVKGSQQETVLYCGDRWADFAGNGLGYNQWFPLSFINKQPYFNSLSYWNLNAVTGEWSVGIDNNYVKNGSFEADRRKIPSPAKPVQTYLLGWTTIVLKGNLVSLDSSTSPELNYFNSVNDRQFVTGEKSLHINDQIDFKRQIFQTITSTPFVTLQDGNYTLTAKVKNSDGFSQLTMYAKSGGNTQDYTIISANANWVTIEIKHVVITNGKVEIGFWAAGKANAFCNVDDVVLIREE